MIASVFSNPVAINRRDVLAGLSVANIFLFRSWFTMAGTPYFARGIPMSLPIAGLLADWLILGFTLSALSAWSRKGRRQLIAASLVFTACLFVPGDWFLRHAIGISLPAWAVSRAINPIVVLVAELAVLAVFAVSLPRLVVRGLPLILAPVIIVTLGFAVVPLKGAKPPGPARIEASTPPAASARVLWLLFDELDYRLIAGQRSESPPLPAFTRLLSETFSAAATSPGVDTLTAVPGILTGRRVVSVFPKGLELMLRFEDGSGAWGEQDSPFRRVREMGLRTVAVGWYHPYCDTLNGQFDDCQSDVLHADRYEASSIAVAMRNQVQEAVGGFSWLLHFGQPGLLTHAQLEYRRERHAQTFRGIAAAGELQARRQQSGLLFVHYPVPHLPGILDIVDPAAGSQWPGYPGNAILADRALAQLRASLEADGRWTDTILVISADHPWRTVAPRDDRVPLIVKLPGAPQQKHFDGAVSLTVLHDLLPRLASGEIVKQEQLAAYLASPR